MARPHGAGRAHCESGGYVHRRQLDGRGAEGNVVDRAAILAIAAA